MPSDLQNILNNRSESHKEMQRCKKTPNRHEITTLRHYTAKIDQMAKLSQRIFIKSCKKAQNNQKWTKYVKLHEIESAEVVYLVRMPPGRLPLEVFWGCPAGRRPRSRP